jgi:hypothetical protein
MMEEVPSIQEGNIVFSVSVYKCGGMFVHKS